MIWTDTCFFLSYCSCKSLTIASSSITSPSLADALAENITNIVTESQVICIYRKSPKFSDTENFAVITLKFEQIGLTEMSPKIVDGMANSEDPDQTAPLGAVWSGSALFAQTFLSENFGS